MHDGEDFRSGNLRSAWVASVARTPHLTDAVKMLLLAIAYKHMNPAGRFSVPRTDLAADIGSNHPQKITEKLGQAIAAGFVERTARGQKHRTAVFEARIPGLAQGHGSGDAESSQGHDHYDAEKDSQGHDHYDAENAQGHGSGDAESSQGHRAGDPPYKGTVDVGDQAKVVNLFSDHEKTPPAGASAPGDQPRPITGQTIVAAYIDGVRVVTGEDPTPRLIGQIGKQAKELLSEKRDPARLVAAAKSLGSKVGKGYTDLGREYLILADRTGAATGTDGWSFENVTEHTGGWDV